MAVDNYLSDDSVNATDKMLAIDDMQSKYV
jgi:hypothetical protein